MKDVLAALFIMAMVAGLCFMAVDAMDKEVTMWEQRVPETMKNNN